jgi:hypothetical protein
MPTSLRLSGHNPMSAFPTRGILVVAANVCIVQRVSTGSGLVFSLIKGHCDLCTCNGDVRSPRPSPPSRLRTWCLACAQAQRSAPPSRPLPSTHCFSLETVYQLQQRFHLGRGPMPRGQCYNDSCQRFGSSVPTYPCLYTIAAP